MAVSKELLARYKEMKAKGINVTLSELKAQMEEEANATTSEIINETYEQSSPIEPESNYSSSSATSYTDNPLETKPEEAENSWTTTYSNSYSYTATQQETPKGEQQTTPSTWTQTPFSTSSYYNNSEQTIAPNEQSQTIEQPQIPEQSHIFEQPHIQNIQQVEPVQPVQEDSINAPIKKFAVIGYPLGHSLSTYIHNAGFKSLGIKASYEILETPPDTLVDRIKYFKTHGYSGFNVTIPLKLPVTFFLDEVDESANIANAVNTVVIDEKTKTLKGYNTDASGFRNAIPNDITLCGKIAGVMGTGGAARAAITALALSQMKEVKIFTRNVLNSLELINYLRKTFPNVEFNPYQIERIRDLSDIDLLVNATPIGMQGRGADFTPVEEPELTTLKAGATVYDIIYNPKKTILLKLAEKHGYRTINGVDMFIHQAVEAEKIWTGKTPDFKDMKIAALENL